MIIFGFRRSRTSVGTETFHCPTCQSQQRCRVIFYQRWFTLFFLPIFPLGRGTACCDCLNCSGEFVINDLPAGNSGTGPSGITIPRSSGLALASVLLGLLSVPMFVLGGLSLLTSIAAVVTGHKSLSQIKQSNGRILGLGMARVGSGLGYTLMAATILIWGGLYANYLIRMNTKTHRETAVNATSDPSEILSAVEMDVTSDDHGTAFGNSEQAVELAKDVTRSLTRMNLMFFTQSDGKGLSLSGGHFITHCELRPNQCAFVVHVPSYRKYEKEAKEMLSDIAWNAAQNAASEVLKDGDRLAIGLRGAMLYGDVLVGTVGEEETFQRTKRDSLLVFFAPHNARSVPSGFDELPVPSDAPEPPQPAAFSEPPLVAQSEMASDPFSVQDLPSNATPTPTEENAVDPAVTVSVPAPPPAVVAVEKAPAPPVSRTSTTAPARPAAQQEEPAPTNLVQEISDLGWGVTAMAYAPTDTWLAVAQMDATLSLFDVDSGQRLDKVEKLDDLGHGTALVFAPDGRTLYVGGQRGTIQAWNVAADGKLKLEASLTQHTGAIRTLVVGAGGAFLASGGDDKRLMWQETSGSRSMRVLDGFDSGVVAVHLPAKGMLAIATDGRTARWVDLRTSKLERELSLEKSSIHDAAFSPDGSLLACCDGYHVNVWELADGRKRQEFLRPSEIQWTVEFLPDGKRLTSGGSGCVSLWELSDAVPQESFPMSSSLYVQTLALNSAGDRLAAITSAAGQSLRVFAIEN